MLASRLIAGLPRNHPFAQGNKRTAFVAGVTLLGLNGCRFNAPDRRDTSQRLIDLVEGLLTEDDYAVWLTQYVITETSD